ALGSFDVPPRRRVAKAPAELGVPVAVVARGALEIGADLRYARHRAWAGRLATGQREHEQSDQKLRGDWLRGRHPARNCAGAGIQLDAGVLLSKSKRRCIG